LQQSGNASFVDSGAEDDNDAEVAAMTAELDESD